MNTEVKVTSNELEEMESTNYSSMNSNMDPKNNEELIIYVSWKIFFCFRWMFLILRIFSLIQVQNLLQNVQDKFQCMSEQIISRIDEMGNRIDDLEQSIQTLMESAGVEHQGVDK